MNLKTDSLEVFLQTSDDPYDRHNYRLNVPGSNPLIVEDYEVLRAIWFEKVRNYTGCTVDVLDIKQKKKKSKGGFK